MTAPLLSLAVDELGTPAVSDTPPAGLAMPGPEVLGPIAERYGIEVIGPPRRVSRPHTV